MIKCIFCTGEVITGLEQLKDKVTGGSTGFWSNEALVICGGEEAEPAGGRKCVYQLHLI